MLIFHLHNLQGDDDILICRQVTEENSKPVVEHYWSTQYNKAITKQTTTLAEVNRLLHNYISF